MIPYNEEYYISQLNNFNSKNMLFNTDSEISSGNFSIKYVDSTFSRIDGYLYKDLRRWNNFPILSENSNVWMSVTPLEIDSHWVPIKLAKGRVCVGGLGLGYYIQNIIDKEEVNEIIVYEINKDVIELYNKSFKPNPKVKIINDDIFSMKLESFDFVYVDIYPTLFDSEAIQHMRLLTSQNNIGTYHFWGMEGYVYTALEKYSLSGLYHILNTEHMLTILELLQYFEKSDFFNLSQNFYFSDEEIDNFLEIYNNKI